jgi:putative OPT family oligopeptide transporter
MGLGALIQAAKEFSLFKATWEHFVTFAKFPIALKAKKTGAILTTHSTSGGALISSPGVSPAYIGVGYIIGPKLAALNFSGGLLAWGLFVPLLLYFLGPDMEQSIDSIPGGWTTMADRLWYYIVKPIAIGGMLVSAAYTLYRMRNNLINGLKRSISDVKKAATAGGETMRTEKDLSLRFVFPAIIITSILTFFIYLHFSQNIVSAIVATIVMIIAGFFFASVSGYLVGMIGSSNNPISGLTISALIVAAVLMVLLGMKGELGVAAVLGVAGVVCVSAAVAGEMLQDLKVGHILGGTPWRMQIGDLIGVVVASLVMFYPLVYLHEGFTKKTGIGFGGADLSAPQAGLMAMLSKGIVEGQMAWPLIIVGMLMAVAFILTQVRSPMLVCVGMYLPLETTFAIFIGGIIKGIVEVISDMRKHNDAQKARVENNGVLLASGLIAGEALIGLLFAYMAYKEIKIVPLLANPSFFASILVFILIGIVLTYLPIKNAGSPDEPAPPQACM